MLSKKMTGDLFVYTIATYFVQLIGIATSFSMRYFLEPEGMGVWSLLDLLLRYGLFVHLGMLTALTA